MIIRRATYEEAKSIKTWDVFIGDRRIDNERGELFVAVYNDEVQGYTVYSSDFFWNKPFIRLLCVKDSCQRKGIATALIQRVLDIYAGLDVWTSTEEWNEAALQLFKKRGFEQKGRISGLNKDNSAELYFALSAANNKNSSYDGLGL